jgi:hypothetical protein
MTHVDVSASLKRLFFDSGEGRRHVAFFAAIPDALVPYMAPFCWHMDKLWALELPVVDLAMIDLRELLNVPYWRAGANSSLFQHSARDVLSDPATHANHWARTMATDLAYPIMLYQENGRRILDGYHRLLKAESMGVSTLATRVVPEELVPTILIENGFLGELNRLRLHTPRLIADARQIARELKVTLPDGIFPDWS